ncbi:MAG: hypothetical protein E4H44_00330 [Candidatus Aminicenantes bacterium]|nr:MAG: hypothetical protein E4H44_00330 [Candidatus Aminicenantes bacterium]
MNRWAPRVGTVALTVAAVSLGAAVVAPAEPRLDKYDKEAVTAYRNALTTIMDRYCAATLALRESDDAPTTIPDRSTQFWYALAANRNARDDLSRYLTLNDIRVPSEVKPYLSTLLSHAWCHGGASL